MSNNNKYDNTNWTADALIKFLCNVYDGNTDDLHEQRCCFEEKDLLDALGKKMGKIPCSTAGTQP
jgi:hypothetical protein